ncbi:MAG: dethiobiotin synthase [Verrucomicrobiota bacterium]
MKADSFFITGTSTEVGKTHFSCLLVSALRQAGLSVAGYKAIACGDRDDAQRLLEVSSHKQDGSALTLDEINPLHFKVPAAPLAAAKIENRSFELDGLMLAYEKLQRDFDCVVSEGVGGWEVPLIADQKVSDLALLLGDPVIVVVDNRLGALNHTILTVNAIRARGLECAGLILNQCQPERDAASISNRVIIEETLDVSILAEILFEQTELDPGFTDQIL